MKAIYKLDLKINKAQNFLDLFPIFLGIKLDSKLYYKQWENLNEN